MLDMATANTISEITATVATATVFIAGIAWARHNSKVERYHRAEAKRNMARNKREQEIREAGLRLMAEDTRRRTMEENTSKSVAAKKNGHRDQAVKLCGFMSGKPKYEMIWQA